MENKKVFIALPIYGGGFPQFWACIMRLQAAPPVNMAIQMALGDSLVSRARNHLTAEFLATDCTHLLFIDSDLVFSGEHIARLLGHGVDVVAGFYPKKSEGSLEWVCNRGEIIEPAEGGLQEMRYMGTGFMLVARTVFEQMISAHPEIAFQRDDNPEMTQWDLWPVGVYHYPDGRARHLSEDWYFCQRWLDLGGKVYGDTKVVLKHIGQASYPLQSQEAELLAPATA